MKPFKIKKNKIKREVFIAEGIITNFKKPKLPLILFKKIHPTSPAVAEVGSSTVEVELASSLAKKHP